MAAFWMLILLPVVVVVQSRPANAINQTEFRKAMADMRAKSYYGFVMLLNILNTIPDPLQHEAKATFFMLDDQQLSETSLSLDSLQDFILRHSTRSGLGLNDLMHLPNGSLIPSGTKEGMIRVIQSRKSVVLVNKATITAPNICLGSTIKCHGISSEIIYEDAIDSSSAPQTKNRVKSFGVTSRNRTARIN